MKSYIFLLPLFLLLIRPSRSYHNLQLVVEWIPTLCQTFNDCLPFLLKTNFTLHGLWPANSAGRTIHGNNCNPNEERTDIASEVNKYYRQLQTHWPGIRAALQDRRFWQEEWNKHGICSLLKMNKTEYFKIAIDKMSQLDMLDILKSNHIVPTMQAAHSKDDIAAAVRYRVPSASGIYISCSSLNATHSKLKDIILCLEAKGKKYIPCRPNGDKRGCRYDDNNKEIILVPFNLS